MDKLLIPEDNRLSIVNLSGEQLALQLNSQFYYAMGFDSQQDLPLWERRLQKHIKNSKHSLTRKAGQ